MTSVLETIRQTWPSQERHYEKLALHVHKHIETEMRLLGLPPRITHRTKNTASFIKKALRKGYRNPFARTTDKAGVRVVVLRVGQVAIVTDLIQRLFRVHKCEDKSEALGVDKLGYQSRHLDISLREPIPTELQECRGKRCEVQVRTMSQDVFAEMAHILTYKSDITVPDELLRRVNCLSALLEVADIEFRGIEDTIRGLPGFEAYAYRSVLERFYYRFMVLPYDTELSMFIIDSLKPLLNPHTPEMLDAQLDAFVKMELLRIEHVLSMYKNVESSIFLSQPEAVLLFWLIESKSLSH